MRTYTYQKAVNATRLLSEIENELGLALYSDGESTPDGHLDVSGSECTVVLNSSLSSEDKFILDSVLDRHVPGLRVEPRLASDDALAVKVDPGSADTDPRFYCDRQSVTTADDWTVWDLPGGEAGKRLQSFFFQTKDAKEGDKISVVIAIAGGELENTEVASFGEVSVRQDRDSNGWSPVDDRGARFQTSKLIPAGLKVRYKYYAAGSGTRAIQVESLVHE